jgi:hypothetical protein
MRLILWPAVITLAVTLIRLAGELQGWSKTFFNPEPGGGGALVGISWLPFVFGGYFAWKLARAGKGTNRPWKAAGMAILSIAVIAAVGFAMSALKVAEVIQIAIFAVASVAMTFLCMKGWPALGRTLLEYALAARIPVATLMLVAIFRNWGTHYDVLPPNPSAQLAQAGPLYRWFWIGLLPQMTIWIAYTVVVGMLVGGVVTALGKPLVQGN